MHIKDKLVDVVELLCNPVFDAKMASKMCLLFDQNTYII